MKKLNAKNITKRVIVEKELNIRDKYGANAHVAQSLGVVWANLTQSTANPRTVKRVENANPKVKVQLNAGKLARELEVGDYLATGGARLRVESINHLDFDISGYLLEIIATQLNRNIGRLTMDKVLTSVAVEGSSLRFEREGLSPLIVDLKSALDEATERALEKFKSELPLEAIAELKSKIQTLEANTLSMTNATAISDLQTKVHNLEANTQGASTATDIATLQTKVNQLEANAQNNHTQLDATTLQELQTKVQALEASQGQGSSSQDLSALTSRIDALETSAQSTSHASDIQELQTKVQALEANAQNNHAQVDATALQELQTKVSQLEASQGQGATGVSTQALQDLESKVANLETWQTSKEASITTLTSKVSALEKFKKTVPANISAEFKKHKSYIDFLNNKRIIKWDGSGSQFTFYLNDGKTVKWMGSANSRSGAPQGGIKGVYEGEFFAKVESESAP